MKKSQIEHKSKNRPLIFIATVCVLILAWVINKDINIPSWLVILVSVLGTFFLLLYGVKKPEVPFYVLIAYVPFNKMLSGTFGGFMTALNLTNILILVTVFCWVMNSMLTKQRMFDGSALNWLVLLFCFLGVFSVIRGGFYYGSRYAMEYIFPLKRWLTPVFLYFIALNVIKNKEILKNTIIILMIVVAAAGLLTVKEGFDLGDAGSLDSSRVNGIAGQPNMMGAFFVYYMFLFLGFFYFNWNKLQSWMLLIPFLICFRGIQVTYSRGAYMAFAFGLAAITFFKNKILFFLMCLGIIFALLNPQFLPGGMRFAIDRTEKTDNKGFAMEQIYEGAPLEDTVDASSANRITIWKAALEMIKDNPLWGVGYGVFGYALGYYNPNFSGWDAHNTYLIIAAEMGIPVLLIFMIIIFILFKDSFWLFTRVEDRFIKAVALGMLGGIVGMLVANMFGSRFESEEVSAYFWVLAGLIMRAVLMKKRKEIV